MEGKKSSKKIIFASVFLCIAAIVGAYFAGAYIYSEGYKAGYVQSLSDVKDLLDKHGIAFTWQDQGNGTYYIQVTVNGTMFAKGHAEIHLWITVYRHGVLLSRQFGAGVLTNIGKDWLEQQISGTGNQTETALWCSASNDATDPPLAVWTQLPSEITNNGLERQLGTYSSTGVGSWTVTCTKTVTGTQSVQLWGLQWSQYPKDGKLLAADSGPSQKNCVATDTEQEAWTVTVS